MQLESLRVLLPHIISLWERQNILAKVDQLLVWGIVEVWDYGDAVVELEAKRVYRIINQDHIFQISISNDSEIFDENAFFCLKAMISVEPELDKRFIRVDKIDDRICVLLVARREHPHLVFLGTRC